MSRFSYVLTNGERVDVDTNVRFVRSHFKGVHFMLVSDTLTRHGKDDLFFLPQDCVNVDITLDTVCDIAIVSLTSSDYSVERFVSLSGVGAMELVRDASIAVAKDVTMDARFAAVQATLDRLAR